MDAMEYCFGITLDQVDQLNRLFRLIAAQGDVIAVGNAIHLNDHSLPALGESIYDAACSAHDLLALVCEQKLKHSIVVAKANAVKEARAVYLDEKRRRAALLDPFARVAMIGNRDAQAAPGAVTTDEPRCIVLDMQSKISVAARRKKPARGGGVRSRASTA